MSCYVLFDLDFKLLSLCEFVFADLCKQLCLTKPIHCQDHTSVIRYQRVLINNSSSNNTSFSEWSKIKHGVPQGSILSPLFFLTYINHLLNITADPSKQILSADDTSIIITNSLKI